MMATGRIYTNGNDEGSGFALAPRIVVTANHVVHGQEASSLRFVLDDGRRFQVERVERDENLDAAVLHMAEDVPEVLPVGPAVEGLDWQVESQPLGNDPLLTGLIDATDRRLVNEQGHDIRAVQLRVEQELGDYRGYSGSAVALKSPSDVVFGVLVEQVHLRLRRRPGERPQPASNVLYAVPIQDVLERFGLTELQEQYHEQDSRLTPEASLLRIQRPISEVDPFETGLVFSSALAERDHEGHEPPYVYRGVDPDLREALKTKQFVLVTGASKAGKSRTAFEAARSIPNDPTLLVPDSAEALPKLLSLGLPVKRSEPSVLWLDELEYYLQKPGMTRTLFDGLDKRNSRMVVLATITLTAYWRLRNSEGEIGRSAREILDLFEEITLPSESSSSELMEAQRLYPGQHFVAGIGEHFAAARELIAEFKTALESHRHGFACVVAALDWRRAGVPRPITREELRELYALCLKRFYPLLEANDEEWQDGLAWARKPLESRAALLMPATDEGVKGFKIFDYVRDWADGAGSDVDWRLQAVLDSTWPFVIDRIVPAQAYAVGMAAATRGNLTVAEEAWTKAIDSEDPEVAPEAALNLGLLYEKQSLSAFERQPDRLPTYRRAIPAYQRALNSRDPEVVLRAGVNLGRIFDELARYSFDREWYYSLAEEAYQRALDSGHPDAVKHSTNLGVLRAQQGKYAEAQELFQRVIDSGDPARAAGAALNLGLLLEEQGRLQEAEEVFQRVIDSGDPELAPQAASRLWRLHLSSPEEDR